MTAPITSARVREVSVVQDLAKKAGKDAMNAALNVACLVDSHEDRFVILVGAVVACLGLADAAFQQSTGEKEDARKAVFDAVWQILEGDLS